MKSFFVAAINLDGHLRTDLQKCTLSPGNVVMNFSETDPLLLVNYYPQIDRFISERIEMVSFTLFSKFFRRDRIQYRNILYVYI